MISANWPAWSNQLMGGTATTVVYLLFRLRPAAIWHIVFARPLQVFKPVMNQHGTGGCVTDERSGSIRCGL